MWLKYGIDANGQLRQIDDAPRGKTNLKCPYCDRKLTAKKGRVKEPHFAHTEQTCRAVSSRTAENAPTLPLYNKFGVELTGEQLDILKRFHDGEDFSADALRMLNKKGIVSHNPYKRNQSKYEITNLGLVAIGKLSLNWFAVIQRGSFIKKLIKFQDAVIDAYQANSPSLYERWIDLEIYRTQIKRSLSQTLYFLEIKADGLILHKIGVTARPISERVAEVLRDLSAFFQGISIKVLGTWEHWGCVENYFKYRYHEFNYVLGGLTEYFKFNNIRSVMRDLHSLETQVLELYEINIQKDNFTKIEEELRLSR